ncbi:major facilitator superfamily domain-containing protein [Diaporthe sp. PMI_573]|nr:major facilitator superfamily domain-containing protein [Diaporthaceae sp. PMI_573]
MRTITGLASAPGLSLLTATIADIFFVHERGFYIAIWNICIGSGGQIGQVICGFIIEDLGVPAVFGFAAIVFALLIVATYFLALESTYDRPEPKPIDCDSKEDLDFEEEEEDLKAPKTSEVKKTYRQQLALWNGRMSNQSFWLGVVKPFGLVVFPAVAYGVLAFSVSFSLLVGVPIVTSVVFAQPPYSLTPSQIGLTNLPLVAVSIIGGLVTGWFANVAGSFMARTNGSQAGVFERTLNQTLPLAWVLVWMSVFSFGTLFNVQVILTYVVDCFPEQSGQAFSTMNLISSLFIFVGSGVLITWYEMVGPMVVFGSLAAASVILLVTTIPLYVFGKRMRAYMAEILWTHKVLT